MTTRFVIAKPINGGMRPLCAKWFRWAGALALSLVFTPPLLAQTGAGMLRVVVEDTSGAAVAGASVQVRDTATSVIRTQKSNTEGYAVFSPIDRGTYDVDVSNPGFSNVSIKAVTIDVNQNREVVARLSVAAVTSTVQVEATAVALQTASSSVSTTVTGNEIVALPLAQRRYTDLTLLAPGATTSTDNTSIRGPGWLVVNGTRSTMNNYLLDGMDNNNNTHNDQSRSAEVIAPAPDALSEFQVLTGNYSAQYGRAAGAVIIASIKSGSNHIHGSVWEFNRITALAANSWLSNHTAGAGKDQLTWNQPGATLGGPIIKNKLFYFGDFEYFNSTAYSSLTATVPTEAMHAGDFSSLTTHLLNPSTGQHYANNQIPTADIDPLGQKVMNLYPLPNEAGETGAGGQTANNYGGSIPLTDTSKRGDVRLDYYASQAQHFSGRYSYNNDDEYQTVLFPGIADSGDEFGGSELARNQTGAVGWTDIISPTLVNVLRLQANFTDSSFVNATHGMKSGTQFGFVGLPASLDSVGSLPRFDFSSYNSLGTGPWRPQYDNPWAYEANDNLSLTSGAQTLQIGFDYQIKQGNWVDLQNRTVAYSFSGDYTGDATADLLLGMPQSVGGETFFEAHERQQITAAYVQDDWKVRRNLTLNLGVRYSYFSPPYGVGGHPSINFDYATQRLQIGPGGPLVYGAERAFNRYTLHPEYTDFSPRLGFAYQISSKFAVHAGFGIFYDGVDISGTDPDLLLNPPNTYPITLQRIGNGPAPLILSQPFPANFLDTSAIDSSTLSLRTWTPNFHAGAVDQWNVSWEALLSPNTTLSVAYVGNRSHNERLTPGANNAPFGVDGSIQANRPFPQWGSMEYLTYLGASQYNSLQVNLTRRVAKGFSILLAYTYARAYDNMDAFGSSGSTGIEVVNQKPGTAPVPVLTGPYGVWGPQTEVSHNRFTAAYVWNLPVGRGKTLGSSMPRALDAVIGNWKVSGIITAQSGLPFSVSLARTGVDPATGQNYSYYQNEGNGLRPDCSDNLTTGNISQWLNPAAFQVPTVHTPGNCGRNSAWGPGLFNWDFSLAKQIPVTEGSSVSIRADFFNIFNHPNFRSPAATFGRSGFGVITSTVNNPRQTQLSVKYSF